SSRSTSATTTTSPPRTRRSWSRRYVATETRLLLAGTDERDLTSLDEYRAIGGYRALAKANAMEPAQIVEEISAATLRGRGGAGLFGDIDIVVHRGAGAYICGEETALLESLEGKRGQPRSRPPFPPVQGLYMAPTQINNVATVASVPAVLDMGAAEFSKIGVA